MDNNGLYRIYVNCELTSKEDVYTFMSDVVCQDDLAQKEVVVNQFNQREKAGSTLIADHVMLPHIESNHIKNSHIIVIRLAKPILSWDEETKDIRLVMGILLKEHENVEIKKKIAMFTRSLAHEDYLNRLLTISERDTFYQALKKF
ncbi:PTS system, nitrogen regulatory IIA component [Evansella caseinilytica]|uniref:PTS system, nitrogen regulatory IIA component n=1 Tax=Evansella caseinilytica TaxID=1503961 RepID=A0A1H3H3F0_9BACI|nr:PTS sugar transporter subunit IIA [Evansella caseinilytica]SDY09981.1 PTS system, nitrogen regulatory IIA component [Evansella caseinilytica]